MYQLIQLAYYMSLICCMWRPSNAVSADTDTAEWYCNHGNVHSNDAMFPPSTAWRPGNTLHRTSYVWGCRQTSVHISLWLAHWSRWISVSLPALCCLLCRHSSMAREILASICVRITWWFGDFY